MNVFTGDSREINLEPFGLSSEFTQIRANSKYLVVMSRQEDLTRVGIFDVKERRSTPLCCFDASANYFSLFKAISDDFFICFS